MLQNPFEQSGRGVQTEGDRHACQCFSDGSPTGASVCCHVPAAWRRKQVTAIAGPSHLLPRKRRTMWNLQTHPQKEQRQEATASWPPGLALVPVDLHASPSWAEPPRAVALLPAPSDFPARQLRGRRIPCSPSGRYHKCFSPKHLTR